MAIVTSSYRPKRAPWKKRPQPPIANRIVTPAPLKPRRGPVFRLREQHQADDSGQEESEQPRRAAIVEPKRKRTSIFGEAPDLTEEEHRRRGDAAKALWLELVRRAHLVRE